VPILLAGLISPRQTDGKSRRFFNENKARFKRFSAKKNFSVILISLSEILLCRGTVSKVK
jgi:hypothetical protein